MVGRIGGVLGLMMLAGCSGGGGSGPATGPLPGDIDGRIDNLPVSNPADLPTTGRAEFNGYMRARVPTGAEGARVDYLADLALQVNFGAGFDQIRGQATKFEARDGVPLGGALAITNGNIYTQTDATAAYSFDGDLAGALTRGTATYTIDGSVEGEFLGQGQTAARGLVFGDITGPRGQDIFDGTFATTRRPD